MSRRSVEEWRHAVFRAHAKATVKLCCLYLADHMSADRKVSRPRRLIAEGLGVSERVVDRMVSDAHSAGLLTTVQRGQKGVTAVYQGLFPDHREGRQRERFLRAEPARFARAETPVSANGSRAPVVTVSVLNQDDYDGGSYEEAER